MTSCRMLPQFSDVLPQASFGLVADKQHTADFSHPASPNDQIGNEYEALSKGALSAGEERDIFRSVYS